MYFYNMSISKSIDEMYALVEEEFKKGLNPTINVRLIPTVPTNLSLNYLEKNTTGSNGDINTNITITVSKPGPPTNPNKEVVRSTNLSSKGFSPDFYFHNIDNELNKLINNFKKSFPQDYNLIFDVYSDSETTNELIPNASSNKVKVYGNIVTVPDGGACNNYGQNRTDNCTNIVLPFCDPFTGCKNAETQASESCNRYIGQAQTYNVDDGGVAVSGYNCNWVNGVCQSLGGFCQTVLN